MDMEKSTEISRLRLAFEQQMRHINRDTLNPMIKELSLADLEPVQRMVAEARGKYLKAVLEIASAADGHLPDDPQIKVLHQHRVRYDELMEAARALETAIQRGYLDIDDGHA